MNFLEDQLLVSAACTIFFGVILLSAELLHFVSGGRTPSLIECLIKWEPKQKIPITINDDDDGEDDGEDDEDDGGGGDENSSLPESA